jgi:SAM-dependent methyltransferase
MGFISRAGERISSAYFETSYRLLTDSPEGRRFLKDAAPIHGAITHGYATSGDLDALVDAIRDGSSRHLVDLGCGMGGMTIAVHRRTGIPVTGIDLSATAIATATERASAAGVAAKVAFLQRSFRHPPRVGADAACAFDSLMFAPVSPTLLIAIRDALDGRARLFATTLVVGRSPLDPTVTAATTIGSRVLSSEDVTAEFVERSRHRRHLARRRFRHGPRTARGQLAMLLVVMEESLVGWLERRGRLRRWRTVVDLRQGT